MGVSFGITKVRTTEQHELSIYNIVEESMSLSDDV